MSIFSVFATTLFITAATAHGTTTSLPRRVHIQGQHFINTATNQPIVLSGPNVVVKGPPYLPAVSGSTHCQDYVNATCSATGTCTSCYTFNKADTDLIRSQGRNFIRLGVVWAGAQPTDENQLDPAFEARLHALLNLTDAQNIHVMLDNHGDMTSSAGCGNGVPMWFSKKIVSNLIGQPLTSKFPFNLLDETNVEKVNGWEVCGSNVTAWSEHAGDPNYNLLNRCCVAMNGGNPGGTGYSELNQKTMNYMLNKGPGRDDFVRFWTLMAKAVAAHPSVSFIEPSNEPMSINRRGMYDTWRAVTEEVTKIIPDISVALADTGEGAVLPGWVYTLLDLIPLPYFAPSGETIDWIKKSKNVFYAWHWYGSPKTPQGAVANVRTIEQDWNVPSFATEFFSCSAWEATAAANISHSYWHYSSYCNTGPSFGNRKVPEDTFGACILGWGGGRPDKCMPSDMEEDLVPIGTAAATDAKVRVTDAKAI